jgi:hypothetical protein
MKAVRRFWHEFGEFSAGWRRFWYWKLYQAFSRFEKVKDVVVQLLYRQRGRFARPFVHTAMGGLVTMASPGPFGFVISWRKSCRRNHPFHPDTGSVMDTTTNIG